MANKVQPRRSYTAGIAPAASELQVHECSINWADGKLFVKREDGTVQAITLGGSYTLPTASSSVLGGVKVGANLTITDGVLAATGGGGGSANIVEATTAAGFPATGASGTLYISRDQSRVFRWDSSGVYIELGN
jgi:hypothetical protein